MITLRFFYIKVKVNQHQNFLTPSLNLALNITLTLSQNLPLNIALNLTLNLALNLALNLTLKEKLFIEKIFRVWKLEN